MALGEIKLRKGLLWVFILIMLVTISNPVLSQISNDKIQKIFLLGRSLGSGYYRLIDLTNKSKEFAYSDIRIEYQNAFQNFNITDLIIEDLNLDTCLSELLKNVKLNLYSALDKQDLSEAKLAVTLDKFSSYYEDLKQSIKSEYSDTGTWLLDLGFYTSFQLESINSKDKNKLFLSGFNKVVENIPTMIPERIARAFLNIKLFEKPELTEAELAGLKTSLTNVIEFFSGYPDGRSLLTESQELVGEWQGIMLTPDCLKHNIELKINKVNSKLSGVMNIDKIAENIPISNIDTLDGYFTFMFKPFGTEKLYIKFDAKLSDNVFSGEIIDVLGQKGYWVLAKVDKGSAVEDKNLDVMGLYIKDMEEKIKVAKQQVLSVSNIGTDKQNEADIKINFPKLKDKIILDK